MKKIILFLFFVIITIILLNSNYIINNILLSFNICFNNLFPSLIPFMLLSNIIIKYNFVEELSNYLSFLTSKILKLNKNCSFAIIMSLISGAPSGAKYLKDLYDNDLIKTNDIEKCIKFCHFNNPIFIINTIGITFLNNKKIGLIILVSHFISAFIIGLIFRNNKFSKINTRNQEIKGKKFVSILNESIINTCNTLLMILGIITFCLIITGIIDCILKIDINYKFIYSFLEITQGLKYLSISSFSTNIKAITASFFISFGGICIHMQVFSILDNKKIRYLPYFF